MSLCTIVLNDSWPITTQSESICFYYAHSASLPPFLSLKVIVSVQLLWNIAYNAHRMKHILVHHGNCADIFKRKELPIISPPRGTFQVNGATWRFSAGASSAKECPPLTSKCLSFYSSEPGDLAVLVQPPSFVSKSRMWQKQLSH